MKLQCTNLHRVYTHPDSYNPSTGKPWTYFVPYDCMDWRAIDPQGNEYPSVDVPCGQCIACRLKQSMEYANRGVMEMQWITDNLELPTYFITLTYDEDHVPYLHKETGEIGTKHELGPFITSQSHMTLQQRDVVNFKKRLRKSFEPLRFPILDCGEYGPSTLRPHYHMICFGLPLDDLQPLKHSRKKVKGCEHNYFLSERVSDIWGNGFVLVAPCNFNTIAYVCRYNLKKNKNDLQPLYDATGIEKEFRHFPKSPALGERYFEDHWQEIYEFDEISNPNFKYKTIRPPKYFDTKLEKIAPIKYNLIKALRADAQTPLEFETYADMNNFFVMCENIEEEQAEMVKSLKNGVDVSTICQKGTRGL